MKSLGFKTLPLSIIFLVLSACSSGGGGGGGGGGPDVISGVNLNGSAVKGIIKNGNVVAEELNSSGGVIRQVGNTTTAADGSYNFTVSESYEGGPIQITISAGTATEMKCDIPVGCGPRNDDITDTNNPTTIDFGEWYKPGDGNLTMTALVAQAATNDIIAVNVTPYTDLASRRAKEAGSLTATAVYNANSEVSNLLGGIDILSTKPLDITDATAINSGGATAVAYAAYSAAIAALATADANGNPDINGVLTTLGSSFSGGTILADDSGTNDAVISLQEIIDGATSTLTQAGTVDTSGTIVALQEDVNNAGGGNVDPDPSSTAGSTTLTKVKTFVSDVRTWGSVIQAELEDSANAFADQAELASTAANASGELLVGQPLNAALTAIGNKFQGPDTGDDITAYDSRFDSGSITNVAGTVTITDGVINGVTVNMVAQIPQDGTNATSFTAGITSATFRSTSTDADITSGTITLTMASGYTIDWGAIDAGTAAQPEISSGSVDLEVSLTQKQDQNGADLAAYVTFGGTLAVSLTNPITDANNEYIWITPESLTLSGNVSSTDGHSLDITLSANITNANSFVPQDSLPNGYIRSNIVAWAYTDTNSDNTDDTFTLTTPDLVVTIYFEGGMAFATESWSDGTNASYQFGAVDLNDAIGTAIVSCAYGQSTQKLCNFANDLFYNYYVWVEGEGGYYVDIYSATSDQDGSVNGELVDPDFILEGSGPGEWLDANVGLTFSLQLSGLPEASITISADRTAYESGTGSITIAYGTRQIVINGSITDGSPMTSIAITNQDGVTMNITDIDNISGPSHITYNGNTYATITELSNGLVKITYIDGTFEIL